MRGSKPAEHRGGRKKSTLNKLIAECWAQYQAGGKMPLDYALRVTRANKGDDSRRDDMAKAAMGGLDAALRRALVASGFSAPHKQARHLNSLIDLQAAYVPHCPSRIDVLTSWAHAAVVS